jgi:stage V sporulation protein R
MNEGWASYWHEKLFLQDDRILGHEVDFARTHAGVTAVPRVGLNPYALGLRIFYYLEELGDTGRYSVEFRKMLDARQRETFDKHEGHGKDFIFKVRENFSDFMFVNTFIDQDFVSRNNLFVAGKRLNRDRMVWEYYVKSRKAEDYRQMLLNGLYHPPHIDVMPDKSKNGGLYLYHHFEGKPLVKDYIANTMLGIEYLWGHPVYLETSEVASSSSSAAPFAAPAAGMRREEKAPRKITWERVLYTMQEQKLNREVLDKEQKR